jgi:hypothetical protein
MGHEDDGRKIGLLPFPGVQETRRADELELELGVSSRIGLPMVALEKRKHAGVILFRVLVGDRRKPKDLRQVERRGLKVDIGRRHRFDRDRLGPKENGPHHEQRENEREGKPNDGKRFSHEDGEA